MLREKEEVNLAPKKLLQQIILQFTLHPISYFNIQPIKII